MEPEPTRKSRHPVRPERCRLLVRDRLSRPYAFYRQCRNYPVNDRSMSCERHGDGPHYLYAPVDDGDVSDDDVRDHLTAEASVRLQSLLVKSDEVDELRQSLAAVTAERDRLEEDRARYAEERNACVSRSSRFEEERDVYAARAERFAYERDAHAEQAARAEEAARGREERERRLIEERDGALARLDMAIAEARDKPSCDGVTQQRDRLATKVEEMQLRINALMEDERRNLDAMQLEVAELRVAKKEVDEQLEMERENYAKATRRLEAAGRLESDLREQVQSYSDPAIEKAGAGRRMRQLQLARADLEKERDALQKDLKTCRGNVIEAMKGGEKLARERDVAKNAAKSFEEKLDFCYAQKDAQDDNLELAAQAGQMLLEQLEECREKLG